MRQDCVCHELEQSCTGQPFRHEGIFIGGSTFRLFACPCGKKWCSHSRLFETWNLVRDLNTWNALVDGLPGTIHIADITHVVYYAPAC